MNSRTLRVAWYGFRATFRLRWGGYLAIVLLIALLGGVAMAAIAGARRTQSSFPAYLASTNPSDLGGIVSVLNPAIGGSTGYDAKLIATIARLPSVARVESSTGLDVLPLGPLAARIDNAFVVAAGCVGAGIWSRCCCCVRGQRRLGASVAARFEPSGETAAG